MSRWDLVGGLGDAEGPALAYNWAARGLVAPLLPWLAMLVLLALGPNRGWRAWWIWLPLALLGAGWYYAQTSFPRLPRDVLNVLTDAPRAMAFGVAALWLLAPYLTGRHNRSGSFLKMWLVLVTFSAASFAVAGGWDAGAAGRLLGLPGGGYPFAISWAGGAAQAAMLAAMSLVIAAAMVVTGIICRGRSLLRLYLGFSVSLLGVLLALAGIAFTVVRKLPAVGEPSEFLCTGLVILLLGLANLLPFLVLAIANGLFRERLRSLFVMKAALAPAAPPESHVESLVAG